MLSVTFKPCMLSVIMLNVVMLSVVAPSKRVKLYLGIKVLTQLGQGINTKGGSITVPLTSCLTGLGLD
jgi:hypothetical protein